MSLTGDEGLTIAEFRSDGARRWHVVMDRRGTPRVWCETATWPELRGTDVLSEHELHQFLAPCDEWHLLIAGSDASAASPDVGAALRAARRCYPDAAVLMAGPASVDEWISAATAGVPLSQRYDLYLLEPSADGRLKASPRPLFRRGATRGATKVLQVRCCPSGPAGTTFAVLAHDGWDYSGVVCMASARVPPGRRTVMATLRRPGKVRFDVEGISPRKETRSWDEVRARVPRRLSDLQPAHLIIAVEVCGSARVVTAHLDRAQQLVANVASDAEYPVNFSLLAYDAHPHNMRVTDDPVTVLAWADRHERVLAQLSVLARQAGARQDHYAAAANIECMLRQVSDLLRDGRGRPGGRRPAGHPVLVTVGSRRPFPAWRDPATDILPCTAHNDWRDFLGRLRADHERMAFGAICGGDRDAEAWRSLGADASADLIVLDAWQFAADLRLLRPPGERVPFPLVDR